MHLKFLKCHIFCECFDFWNGHVRKENQRYEPSRPRVGGLKPPLPPPGPWAIVPDHRAALKVGSCSKRSSHLLSRQLGKFRMVCTSTSTQNRACAERDSYTFPSTIQNQHTSPRTSRVTSAGVACPKGPPLFGPPGLKKIITIIWSYKGPRWSKRAP